MTGEEKKERGVDRLLKQVMSDDLPANVRVGMQRQIRDFNPVSQAHNKLWLTAASLVLVVLGGYLQMIGTRSPLAESLATLQTSMSFSIEIERTTSMVCSVDLERMAGDKLHYEIVWAPPGKTRVDLKAKDGQAAQTLWIDRDHACTLDHVDQSVKRWTSLKEFEHPLFRPVMGLLTPRRIAERMDGRWQLQTFKREGNCDVGNYRISHPQDEQEIQLTVDVCTFLPEKIVMSVPVTGPFGRMDQIRMSVHFSWNRTIPASFFKMPAKPANKNMGSSTQQTQEE